MSGIPSFVTFDVLLLFLYASSLHRPVIFLTSIEPQNFISLSLGKAGKMCTVEMYFSLRAIEEATGKDGHASASLLNCLQCPAKLRNDLSKSGLPFIPLP